MRKNTLSTAIDFMVANRFMLMFLFSFSGLFLRAIQSNFGAWPVVITSFLFLLGGMMVFLVSLVYLLIGWKGEKNAGWIVAIGTSGLMAVLIGLARIVVMFGKRPPEFYLIYERQAAWLSLIVLFAIACQLFCTLEDEKP